MTRLFLITFCLLTGFLVGQSQGKMNDDASKNYQKADSELNAVYQKILKEYKDDLVFIKNFKIAQSSWVQFRDAEMKAKYPDREEGYYGSVQPMCWSMFLEELTKERTLKLKVWLIGVQEGDVCAGSVKNKS